MAQEAKRVMISSTAWDLPEHRKQAIDACLDAGLFPEAMEYLPAQDSDAVTTSMAMVDRCHIYVVILAWRYGTVLQGYDRSVTEMEFDRAFKNGLPILAFTIGQDHVIADGMVQNEGDSQKLLRAFKDKACNGRIRKEFRSAENLGANIFKALVALRPMGETFTRIPANFRLIPSNIPPLPTHYIKRTDLLNEISDSLANSPNVSLHGGSATLHAEGGFGKSVAALAYALGSEAKYPGGRYLLTCEGQRIEDLLASLLDVNDEVLKMGNPERAGIVKGLLSQQPALLILDNVESREQWREFNANQLLNIPGCHVLTTTRADNLPGESILVEKLTLEETRDLLARFRPSAALPEHADAIETIWRETEGLAVLVAAVGAVRGHEDKSDDWAGYAEWLKSADPESLPGDDETNYPHKAITVLRDLHRRLEPAQVRALEYAALLPADRIRPGWLEWLLSNEDGLDLGTDSTGSTRKVEWHLEQLKSRDILRNSEGFLSVHRLHRKISDVARRNVEMYFLMLGQLYLLSSGMSQIAGESYARLDYLNCLQGLNESIALKESVRGALGEHWSPELHNDLARTYVNRGNAHMWVQNLEAAILDFGIAIEIEESFRDSLGEHWSIELKNDLVRAYASRADAYYSAQNFDDAIRDCDIAIKLGESLRGSWDIQWEPIVQNNLASAYLCRGITYRAVQDFSATLSDLGTVIELRESLRETLGALWSHDLQNDLAKGYGNRGNVHIDIQDFSKAISDYEIAIELMESLRVSLGVRWSPELQNDLAKGYMNRGRALQAVQDYSSAISDYGIAITLRESLRSSLEPNCPPVFKNDLAATYINRGNAWQGVLNFEASISDYGFAIELREALRDSLNLLWSAEFQNDLANAYINRGNVQQRIQEYDSAILDYGVSISLMEMLLDSLGDHRSPALQSDLAMAYMNRGTAQHCLQNFAESISDYGVAIKLREDIRDSLNSQWPPQLQNDLASSYVNRGTVQQGIKNLEGAISDYTNGIEIGESLRKLLGGHWSSDFQSVLALAYMNRGTALLGTQNIVAAISDFGVAIDFMGRLRDSLGELWPPQLQNDFANAYMNCGIARQKIHDLIGAKSEYEIAINLLESLREKLEPLGFWHKGLRDDYALALRNRAITHEAMNSAELADADRRLADEIDAIQD